MSDLDLPTAVSLVGAAVDRRVLESLSAAGLHGLRTGHGHVIQRLIAGPSTVGEIADAVGVTQQAVSKTVKELVLLGYVEQSQDPSDRRRRPLALTPAGRRAVTTARRSRTALQDELAAAVPARDLAAAGRVLRQLARALDLDDQVARRSVPAPPDRT
ncbi:MAG TPA: MarR family winged helix-turn-helix transcriptional regulator [Candidatus Nanopelagicales bacterium]|nr:MarR family winged helix-turn-helix transcriptional regulator [Candidatus Nanopelagicales bacterium]